MSPDEMADAFAKWASEDGILTRITEEQCADLARAFSAGYLAGKRGATVLSHASWRHSGPCSNGCTCINAGTSNVSNW